MKSFPPRNRPTQEFAARRLPDALRRARRDLGEDAPLRCWKVRRGGVMGFFAHEYYVAGLTPPTGALPDERFDAVDASAPARATFRDETTYARDRRRWALGDASDASAQYEEGPFDLRAWDDAREGHGALAYSTSDGAMIHPRSDDPPAYLADLVAATSDELTLGADDATRRAFGEVLAQAEALLTSPERPLDDPPVVAPETREPPDSELSEAAPARVRVPSVSPPPSLRRRLDDLGVPREYLPPEGEGFDALWTRMSQLPRVEELAAHPGQVIAVVGSRDDALITAELLVRRLGLAARDVLDGAPSSELRRRIQRRRRGVRTSIIIVVASPQSDGLEDERRWLEHVNADRVVGAVGGDVKRADLRRWLDRLDAVQELACWRVGTSAALADVMGLVPIGFLDAHPASTMRWMSLLVGALGECEP